MISVREIVDVSILEPNSIPVVYNIHKKQWTNASGNKYFYLPQFEFLDPSPNEDISKSSFTFNTITNGKDDDLRAVIKIIIKKGRPSFATSNMEPVPCSLHGSLNYVLYQDNEGRNIGGFSSASIKENVDSIELIFNLKGKDVSCCYEAISGMSKTFPPPILFFGIASMTAFVPLWVTLQDLDNEHFETDFKQVEPPDITQFKPYEIFGIPILPRSLMIPCSTMGNLYLQTSNFGTVVLGCRNNIGQVSLNPFQEIIELRNTDFYRIYRHKSNINRYVVVPNVYKIGFRSEEKEGKYIPDILIQSLIKTSPSININFLFNIMLLPDIPPFARKELYVNISQLSPTPLIEYISQLDIMYDIDIIEKKSIPSSKEAVAFYINIPLAYDEALILRDLIINSNMARGKIRFQLSEGVMIESSIILDLTHLAGPWLNGPIEVTIMQDSVKLTNKIPQIVNIPGLLADMGTSSQTKIPVAASLKPSESKIIPLPNKCNEILPIYSLSESNEISEMKESIIYITESQTKIQFIDLINHQNHKIQELSVRTRLRDSKFEYLVPMSGNPLTGSLELMLNINDFSTPIIEFQITVKISEVIHKTDWINWNLSINGNIISLVSEMIQNIIESL